MGWISYLRVPIGLVISTMIYLQHLRAERDLGNTTTDIKKSLDQQELARKYEIAQKKLSDE
jgi:TRAP-type C4-dicarboxylate transport system permease small subunit